jgi:predicted Zn-ribbon and HTH transcriptional regulator
MPDGMETIRKQMIELLSDNPLTARELSQALGIPEKEVFEHLPFVTRTATAHGRKLEALPFSCRACGYVFRERKRLDRPGRCPACKSGHVEEPRYRII